MNSYQNTFLNGLILKFADCGGMVLEEQPAKMAEALRHFLQGLGYGNNFFKNLKSISK